jgi:hypothetical protein
MHLMIKIILCCMCNLLLLVRICGLLIILLWICVRGVWLGLFVLLFLCLIVLF